MANFNSLYTKLIKNEGGYVNNPNDAGGETYKGICRKYYKNAKFWEFVDIAKSKYNKTKTINTYLEGIKSVQDEIKAIYKKEYWDVFNLDNINNEKLAFQIFDSAVNVGTARTKIMLNNLNIK